MPVCCMRRLRCTCLAACCRHGRCTAVAGHGQQCWTARSRLPWTRHSLAANLRPACWCVCRWQGTAPSCAHGDECDAGWEFLRNGMSYDHVSVGGAPCARHGACARQTAPHCCLPPLGSAPSWLLGARPPHAHAPARVAGLGLLQSSLWARLLVWQQGTVPQVQLVQDHRSRLHQQREGALGDGSSVCLPAAGASANSCLLSLQPSLGVMRTQGTPTAASSTGPPCLAGPGLV